MLKNPLFLSGKAQKNIYKLHDSGPWSPYNYSLRMPLFIALEKYLKKLTISFQNILEKILLKNSRFLSLNIVFFFILEYCAESSRKSTILVQKILENFYKFTLFNQESLNVYSCTRNSWKHNFQDLRLSPRKSWKMF